MNLLLQCVINFLDFSDNIKAASVKHASGVHHNFFLMHDYIAIRVLRRVIKKKTVRMIKLIGSLAVGPLNNSC